MLSNADNRCFPVGLTGDKTWTCRPRCSLPGDLTWTFNLAPCLISATSRLRLFFMHFRIDNHMNFESTIINFSFTLFSYFPKGIKKNVKPRQYLFPTLQQTWKSKNYCNFLKFSRPAVFTERNTVTTVPRAKLNRGLTSKLFRSFYELVHTT